tara:strand:+ start:32178 stop:32624 length:447 start_codon:yes stop_codon:yes gene_type:complete
MIVVIQICSRARVTICNKDVAKIKNGILIFLGIEKNDNEMDVSKIVNKIYGLRIFNDRKGKMNLSIKDVKASAIVVSQFTLCASNKKGMRPSFSNAEKPDKSYILYKHFIECLKLKGITTESGKFGETMDVELTNQGPATFILNSGEI